MWVSETSEPRSACADSMIRWASACASWTICSRSPSRSWACDRDAGSAAETSSSIASSSARFNTQEADIGMDRAPETAAAISSSFFWTSTTTTLLLLELGGERLQHRGRYQVRDVTAPLGDFLHQAGGQEAVGGVGGDEQGLHPGQPDVHLRHLQLVVEVADRAQPLDDGGDVALLAEVDQQAVEGLHLDVAQFGRDLLDQGDALVDREQALFGLVDHHRDVHGVVQPRGAGDDVEVSVGDGVEGPRTDYAAQDWLLALRTGVRGVTGARAHDPAHDPVIPVGLVVLVVPVRR